MVGYHSHNLTGKSIAVVVINGNQNIYICKKKRWFNCESISILMIWLIWKTGSKKIILTEYCLWLSCHLNIWCTSAMNRNANQGKLHHRSLIQAASNFFLAVQNSSIGDLVTHSLTHSVTFWFWHYRVTLETCDLWDIWSEWWGDMTWPKNTYLPTYLPIHLPNYLSTYLCISIREHPKRAIIGIWEKLWDYPFKGVLQGSQISR